MVWEEKCPFPRFSEFSILPYAWNRKLGNLRKFSFTSNFYRFDCSNMGKVKTSWPHVLRQINKDTAYKEAPIYPYFFLNDVNCFLRNFLKKAFQYRYVSQRSGRKLGNLGNFFPTFSLPTFRFWPSTENQKLGRRKFGKKAATGGVL